MSASAQDHEPSVELPRAARSGVFERFLALCLLCVAGSLSIGIDQKGLFELMLGMRISDHLVGLATLSSVAAVATVAYLLHPILVDRRFGRGRTPSPSVLDECETAQIKAGVRRVTFTVTEKLLQQDALAFGFPFKRQVRLGGGMLLVLRKNPDHFRAILAHELAHIKNRDVDIAHASRYIFWATAICILMAGASGIVFAFWIAGRAHIPLLWQYFPYAIGLGTGEGSFGPVYLPWMHSLVGWGLGLLIRAGVLVGLVAVEYRALLRQREFYADIEAAKIVPRGILGDLMGRAHSTREAWYREIWSFHPSVADRLTILNAPSRLLRAGPADVIVAGAIVGLLLNVSTEMVGGLPDESFLALMELVYRNLDYAISLAIVIGSFLLIMLVMASQNLRLSMAYSLGRMTFRDYVLWSVVLAGMFVASLILGLSFDPVPASNFLDGRVLEDMSWDWVYAYGGPIVITTVLFGIYLRYVFLFAESDRIGIAGQIFLRLCWVFNSLYMLQFLASFLLTEQQLGGDRLQVTLGLAVPMIVPVVLLLGYAFFHRSKRRRRRLVLADASP